MANPKLDSALTLCAAGVSLQSLEDMRKLLSLKHDDVLMAMVVITIEIMTNHKKTIVHDSVIQSMLNMSNITWERILIVLEEHAPQHYLALTTPTTASGVH